MDVLALPFLRPFAPWATLILRIALGLVMANHGWSKFGNMEGTTGFFTSLGIPAAGVMAWVVTLVELVGGICVVLGLATRFWTLLMAFVALVAIVMAKMKDGLWVANYELELMVLAASLLMATRGPGAPSLDEMLGIERG